ncbi:Uncharacterised protein [Vibrio cholerae]|nr:Uncharacterised protein [Vibrio cholerae]
MELNEAHRAGHTRTQLMHTNHASHTEADRMNLFQLFIG